MAVLGALTVGSGLVNFLSPNYSPVSGRANSVDWTYGGGGNYIRPWTSYSQRIVEATNSLGPFAMRLGGNITGRILISTQSESLGQLGYCDQPWYTVNDGNTGHQSKAEWWGSVVKTVIQVRDLNTANHPMIHVEVAVFDPTDPNERYNPPTWWDNFSSTMNGFIPDNIGWLTGNPFPTPPNDTAGTPPVSDMAASVANWAANMISNFAVDIITSHTVFTGEVLSDAEPFIKNVMNGIEAGQMGVNNHIDHNRTPPDSNGDFTGIPGETPLNPKDLILRNGLQQDYAANLGDGSGLTNSFGDVTTPNGIDSGKLSIAVVNQGLDTSRDWYGIANGGRGTTAFYIHGRTIYNDGNSGGNPAAATNPTIDNDGNLRVYDTYEFQNSGLDWVANTFVRPFSDSYANELQAWFDTSPGFHTAPSLSDAGAVRTTNEGNTPGNSNISSLQNTYTGVVVTPHNLQSGNPTLYNELRTHGFYDHVDPELLP
jgi:hypothetical protein